GPEAQVDAVLGVPAFFVDEDRVAPLTTLQVALGQRGPFVRVVRLVADEDDLPLEPLRAERLRGPGPGERGSDDHERGSRWHHAASVGSVTTSGSSDTGHLKPEVLDSPVNAATTVIVAFR